MGQSLNSDRLGSLCLCSLGVSVALGEKPKKQARNGCIESVVVAVVVVVGGGIGGAQFKQLENWQFCIYVLYGDAKKKEREKRSQALKLKLY